MDSNVNLEILNDEQKAYLALIAYMNINKEGKNKIANGKPIKISELPQYLESPNVPYFGKVGFDKKGLIKFDVRRGKYSPLSVTCSEMVDHMIDIGLKEVQITAVRDEHGIFSSGFQAFAFEDSVGNIGISYRGSDLDITRGAIREWVEANFLEYFISNSTQVKQAQDFFDKYKHKKGNTYIYGGSLGGNLSQHVYVRNYDEICQVFTVNGNPINQKLLDTPEKIAAFNNPDKASFYIIGGDIIGLLKNCDLYSDTIYYVKNNGTLRDLNGLESHLFEAATYDENHNFVRTTRKEALELVAPAFDKFTGFTRSVRDILNDIENHFVGLSSNKKNKFNEFAKEILEDVHNLFIEMNQVFAKDENLEEQKLLDKKDKIVQKNLKNDYKKLDLMKIKK